MTTLVQKDLAKKMFFLKKGQKEMEFVKIGLFVYHMPTFFYQIIFLGLLDIFELKNYLKRILVEKFIRAKKKFYRILTKKQFW